MICKIVPEKCIACGLCQVLAPAIFDYTADGIVLFANSPTETELSIAKPLHEQAMAAYKECPTRAIVIPK